MKKTDYAPRAAAMDTYLTGQDLIGIEVGVDAGAHAEALLKYCPVKHLTLIDIWDNEWIRGYCEGRLSSFRNRYKLVKGYSHSVSSKFHPGYADFIYIDIGHDYDTASKSLNDWWPVLKENGILGYRNYSIKGIEKAVDEFISKHKIPHEVDPYHNEIILFK